MEARFDRLEQLIIGVDTKVAALDAKVDAIDQRLGRNEQKTDSLAAQLTVQGKRLENIETVCRATATRLDAVSLQVAGVSKRVDRLSARSDQHDKHQRRFAVDVTKRLKKAEAKELAVRKIRR